MFKPEKHYKRPTDVTRPPQHFDNFFGGGYFPSPAARQMPKYEIVDNPYVTQIEQLNRRLREKDIEIAKLKTKNEMLEEQLLKAQEKLAKGQFVKTQPPFGIPSPHPPYGKDT